MLIIYLSDHIVLSLCEVITGNQEYSIYDFSNFHNRTDLKLFLHYSSLYGIRTERYAEAETFIKIKWCYFNKLIDSIIISKFSYWQSVNPIILQMVHIKTELSFNLLIKVFYLAVSFKVVGYWNQRADVQLF